MGGGRGVHRGLYSGQQWEGGAGPRPPTRRCAGGRGLHKNAEHCENSHLEPPRRRLHPCTTRGNPGRRA